MSVLTEKHGRSHVSNFFSSFSSNKSPVASGAFKPFEEIVTRRLRSLLPIPDSSRSVSLLWISRAVHLLSITLSDAISIISDPSISTADLPSISSYLDSTIALLDICNAISAETDRILRGRLHVLLALRLLQSSSSTDHRRRASSALAEWKKALSSALHPPCSSIDHVRRIRSIDPNRGRLTAARRTIYAVEVFSDLVARSALAVLGVDDSLLSGIRDSDDFAWSAAYSEVVAAVSGKLLRGERAGEIEKAEVTVSRLAAVVDKVEGDVVTEELENAVRGAEMAMEELTEGMNRLTESVNGLFRAGLETRNAAVHCFRGGRGKCK